MTKTELQDRVEGLEDEVVEKENEVEELEGEKKELEDRVEELEDEKKELEDRVEGLEDEVVEKENEVEELELLEQIANRLERIDVTLNNLNAKVPAPQQANADQVTFARLHAEYDIEADRISRAIPFGYKVEWYIHNASLRFLLRYKGDAIAGFKYDERDQIDRFARQHNSNKE